MQDFNIEKIHNTVWVFKNALKDHEDIVKYFNENRDWVDWYTFGTMANGSEVDHRFNSFPTNDEWSNKLNEFYPLAINKGDPGYFEKTIDDLFYKVTKLYLQENSIELDNWLYLPWNVAKYHVRPEFPYAMHHHTDYQRELEYVGGLQIGITAVFYLNDNYQGGDVEFRFVDDDINIIKEDYTYKPSAGDIVVFLSGHPHYHGVKSVLEGEKYIIRTYWRYNKEPHPRWLEMENKYGKEKWEEMEKARLKYTYKNQEIINNIPKFIDFEEYYLKLESGQI